MSFEFLHHEIQRTGNENISKETVVSLSNTIIKVCLAQFEIEKFGGAMSIKYC